ncbi:MAG: hypothetical protein ACREEM_35835 [Blastocatellia bacterium]
MTTAGSEILERAESLSSEEQLGLAVGLMEQARQTVVPLPRNSPQREAPGGELLSQPDAEESVSETDEADWLDVFSLNHVPPIASYVIQVKFADGGRGQPDRYDFSDLFDDEDEGEE